MAKVDLAQYTYRIEDWATNVASLQKEAIDAGTTGDRHYGASLKESLKEKVKVKGELPERIAFQFVRHGIFLQLGVSKGYRIQEKGSGVVVKTGPGEFNREKVDWFTTPLKSQMDDLASIIAQENARIAANGLSLGISTLNIRGLE